MSPATLRRCMREAEEGVSRRPPGRPSHGPEEHDQARRLVTGALERTGWSAGEGAVYHALDGEVPLRLVRAALRDLKAARRARMARKARRTRTSLEVEARDALWSLDATHLGRDAGARAVQAEVVREVASTRTIEVRVGPAADARDVIATLEAARRARETLPLVLASDNGPAYVSEELEAYLAEHEVIHLRSLPRTPQHNAWSEHGMRELKEETGLGKGVRVDDQEEALACLLAARDRLDEHRPRRSRGWRTAAEHDAALPRATALVDRTSFYETTRCAVDEAVLHSTSERERRRSTRAAILHCMQTFGLITMTRGGAQVPDAKSCRVS